MDNNNPEIRNNPGGGHGPTGSWSRRSISRVETLLRGTFNPSLKWLLHSSSNDEDEEEEEESFVVTHSQVSQSSARLRRLQQAFRTAAAQWQLVGGAQVCAKAPPAEGGVLLLPSSSSLQGHFRALWRDLEQRSLLLFIHEYVRRARLTRAYVSKVSHLLEDKLKKSHQTKTPSSWSSFSVGLVSLNQELQVHLNHWSCLFSKVQSDHYLRSAVVQQTGLLVEIKQTLDLLGLQALVLMEHYVYVILSAVAQAELDFVPREVLEDILAGTHLYNHAVGEQRMQHSATQLRTAVLQQAQYSTLDSNLLSSKRHHPAPFSVKELIMILAVHRADIVAKQLHCWAFEQDYHICQIHSNHDVNDNHQPHRQPSSCHTCHKTPHYIPGLHLDRTTSENHRQALAEPTFVQHRAEGCYEDQTSWGQASIFQTGPTQTSVASVQPNPDRPTCLENCILSQTVPLPPLTFHRHSVSPPSEVCQHASLELLFQLLVSSNGLLAPLASHTPTPEAPTEQLIISTMTDGLSPNGKTEPTVLTAPIINNSVNLNTLTTGEEDQNVEGDLQEWAEQEITARSEATVSSGFQRAGEPEKREAVGGEGATVEPRCLRLPRSVPSPVFADLFGQYHRLLWALCSKALWLQFHASQAGNTARSINLQDNHNKRQILHRISQASKTDLVPEECRDVLEDFSLCLLAITEHAQWDCVACSVLGSALKDKCLAGVSRGTNSVMPPSKQDRSAMMSATTEQLLLLAPLCCRHSNSKASGSCTASPSRLALQRRAVSLALATVQLSTMWVMSKAYHFLSSWSLHKFLLIVQGDLKVLMESLEMMVLQTKSLMINSSRDRHPALNNHNQRLLKRQLKALDEAASKLQTFSSLVLKSFSSDCKKMSADIFEQTMPSAAYWRPGLRTGFPSYPSEYASLAVQAVIGQVLEGVVPLSDDACVQALSVTMTAFMEAWMEHILKQKIKFSFQGALQLRQDFDSIRELIQSDKYGLSAELHQQLLNLRVFQQVDSAVVCLLQQPQARTYLPSRALEAFTRCCQTNSSRGSLDAVVGGSITSLRYMEADSRTQSNPPAVTTDLPPVDPSTPREPCLAPSPVVGAAQQGWMELRVHSDVRRWRLPGLQCLSKSEP